MQLKNLRRFFLVSSIKWPNKNNSIDFQLSLNSKLDVLVKQSECLKPVEEEEAIKPAEQYSKVPNIDAFGEIIRALKKINT